MGRGLSNVMGTSKVYVRVVVIPLFGGFGFGFGFGSSGGFSVSWAGIVLQKSYAPQQVRGRKASLTFGISVRVLSSSFPTLPDVYVCIIPLPSKREKRTSPTPFGSYILCP